MPIKILCLTNSHETSARGFHLSNSYPSRKQTQPFSEIMYQINVGMHPKGGN